jgi:hypothetical protein
MAEAGYSGRTMAQKLGVKDGTLVALVDAPAGWSIAGAPRGARVRRGAVADFGVAVWFVRSLHDLRAGLSRMARATRPAATLWLAWPRRAGGHDSDVTEQAIRDLVLPLGLVDVKVAALNQDWSGLKLVWRLSRR